MALLTGAPVSVPKSPLDFTTDLPLSSASFLGRIGFRMFISVNSASSLGLVLPEHFRGRRRDEAFAASAKTVAATAMDLLPGAPVSAGFPFPTFLGKNFRSSASRFGGDLLPAYDTNRGTVVTNGVPFEDECEDAINELMRAEYNVSYAYHALYAYFDRDNVADKGLAKFFKESSKEEREHAEKLMDYLNWRGGRVKLHPIINPPSEYEHAEKSDALYAMELALSLEKEVNEKLLHALSVAPKNNDPHMAGFIEREILVKQIETLKKISDYLTQLRMVGKDHGVAF